MVQGALVTLLARRQGLSLRELARRAGVPYPTVRHIARQEESNPYAVTLSALAAALGVESDVLLGKKPVPDSDIQEQQEAAGLLAGIVTELRARGDEVSLDAAALIAPYVTALATDPAVWQRAHRELEQAQAEREHAGRAGNETTRRTPAPEGRNSR